MPMRRTTRGSLSGPELPQWLTRTGAPTTITPQLAALFRHAARCALASSLTLSAAGCGTTFELPDPNPNNTAGSGAGVGLGTAGSAGNNVGGYGGYAGEVGGTGGSAGSFVPDGGPGSNPICLSDGTLDLSQVTLQEPADFFAWRQDYTDSDASELGRRGTPCLTAQDVSGCLQYLNDLSNHVAPNGVNDGEDGGVSWQKQDFLVTTQGDTVTAAVTPAAQRALLGIVDSVQEAVLMATLAGEIPDAYLLCQQTQVWEVEGGYEMQFEHDPGCAELRRIRLFVGYDGTVTRILDEVAGLPTCVAGRRPEGLACESAPDALHTLAGFFSDMAQLEAASVSAFRTVASELTLLGAPSQLVAAAERAADDEILHAAITAQLSRRFGAEPKTPTLQACPLRDLEAFARDNAVEGCVRETYGAAMAVFQAQAAADEEIRAALALIARDETRHASLSWEIAAWVEPKLDAAARVRVRSAQIEAVRTLARELRVQPAAELQAQAGLPDVVKASQLLATLNHALWGVS